MKKSIRHVKVTTPSQTITVELTAEQTEAIESAYFKHALMECDPMGGLTKRGQFYIGIAHNDYDWKPELKINLEKTIRDLAKGNYLCNDYEECQKILKSFERICEFLKKMLEDWPTEDEETLQNDGY